MTLYPIEVKKTSAPAIENAKNFNLLSKLGKQVGTGTILCLRSSALPLNNDVIALPVWDI
jgi:hypothetical protein